MPRVKDDTPSVDLTPAFRIWAKRKNIRPIDLADAMGWSPSYAWEVLRGKHLFSLEAHGRFILVYGLGALEEIYRIAKVDPKGIENIRPE